VPHVWKTADKASPTLWDPTEYGWVLENEKFIPFMTEKLPAPEEIIHLIKCNCKKDAKLTNGLAK
jgi:hypothetical protein